MSKEWWLEIRIKCEKCRLERTVYSTSTPIIITECHNCYHNSFKILKWHSNYNIVSNYPSELITGDRVGLEVVNNEQ